MANKGSPLARCLCFSAGAGPAWWPRCDAELKASGDARFLVAGLFCGEGQPSFLLLIASLERTHWFEANRRFRTAASVQGVHIQRCGPDSVGQHLKSGGGTSLCDDLTDAVLEPL